MPDIRLEREFGVTPERLFDFVTKRASVLEWFGYEGMTFPNDEMDFSRTGPWFVEMLSKEGNRMKLSGHVTLVDWPKTVGFTWGWHSPEDKRGPESHVMFTIMETAGGAKLIIDHRELPEAEAEGHTRGWTYALGSMSRILND